VLRIVFALHLRVSSRLAARRFSINQAREASREELAIPTHQIYTQQTHKCGP
jgi:hypothetical protein